MSATPAAAQHRRSIGRSELFDLKQLFGVSVQALVMRGRDIGIFSAPLVRELFGEFKRRGWRDPPYEELHTLEGELPGRFQRICFRAVAEGAISDAKAAELLELPVREVRRRIDDLPNISPTPAT